MIPLMWVADGGSTPGNVAYVNSGTAGINAVAATNLDVPFPATVTAGNVLVLHYSGTSGTVTVPVGWTTVKNIIGSGTPRLMVAIKVALGSESGNLAVTTANVGSAGQIHQFSGVDTTTPEDVAASEIINTTTTFTSDIPAVTTVTNNALGVFFGAANSGSVTATSTDGTEIGDFGAGRSGAAYYTAAITPAGTTGTRTITWSASRTNCGALLVLRPA